MVLVGGGGGGNGGGGGGGRRKASAGCVRGQPPTERRRRSAADGPTDRPAGRTLPRQGPRAVRATRHARQLHSGAFMRAARSAPARRTPPACRRPRAARVWDTCSTHHVPGVTGCGSRGARAPDRPPSVGRGLRASHPASSSSRARLSRLYGRQQPLQRQHTHPGGPRCPLPCPFG